MFLVDSHCHLDMLDLTPDKGDMNAVVQRAQDQGVRYLLNVCVNLKDFPTVLKTAERFDFVGASLGLHPNDSDDSLTEEKLIELGQPKKVVAIGETGLDYYRTTEATDAQREQFRMHIRAAKALNKPLIVHTRQAQADTIKILQEEKASKIGGVMHCFTEDWAMAKQSLDLGFYISFSGIVTFKNAATIQDVANKVPLNRMLVETDAPYLAPVPFRGKPNEPSYVRHTAEYIANLRNISVEELAEQTTNNFFNLFKGAEKPHV